MKAPENIPEELLSEFSMDGQVVMEYKYANDCSDETQALINANFTQEIFDNSIRRIKNKERNYYGHTDTWMYQALQEFPVAGKNVCLMGSTHPWYEAMLIEHGVSNCTVIEYSKREPFHKDITYLQPHEVGDRTYDACISISSYEHDGLGRYGDPLNPNGDLEAMKRTASLLNPDGLLYLSIPIGLDKVVFNLHRVYGRIRIEKMLEGWETIEKYGFFSNSFDNNVNGVNGSPYQPIYVLKQK